MCARRNHSREPNRIVACCYLLVDDAFVADRPGQGPGPEVMALDRAELAGVTGAIRELADSLVI